MSAPLWDVLRTARGRYVRKIVLCSPLGPVHTLRLAFRRWCDRMTVEYERA